MEHLPSKYEAQRSNPSGTKKTEQIPATEALGGPQHLLS
jgi:hypothetical protein